jgi:hypothetical protein
MVSVVHLKCSTCYQTSACTHLGCELCHACIRPAGACLAVASCIKRGSPTSLCHPRPRLHAYLMQHIMLT